MVISDKGGVNVLIMRLVDSCDAVRNLEKKTLAGSVYTGMGVPPKLPLLGTFQEYSQCPHPCWHITPVNLCVRHPYIFCTQSDMRAVRLLNLEIVTQQLSFKLDRF